MNGGENRRGRLPKWALGAVSQKPPHLLARILWVLGQALPTVKKLISKIPIVGNLAKGLWRLLRGNQQKPMPFPGSKEYWERRYAGGGNSGVGSYSLFAQFKAEIINEFVAKNAVKSVIEFGCGDGNQLLLANYPQYLGIDVSPTVIKSCQEKFRGDPGKTFKLAQDYQGEMADLSLSLDVIFHLVEDRVFEEYMGRLFKAASRYVIVYSSDSDDNAGYEGTHVKHRRFTEWVQHNAPGWKLIGHIPNKYPYTGDYKTGSFADFYLYQKC
jgi:SAM-dependent methyltransferase